MPVEVTGNERALGPYILETEREDDTVVSGHRTSQIRDVLELSSKACSCEFQELYEGVE